MKLVTHIASLVWLLAIAGIVVVLRSAAGDGQNDRHISRGDRAPEAVVDEQGHLHVPSNYRAAYAFLGTWAIAADNAVASRELHTVYADPGTIAAYRTSGHFPEGAVLIKEVYQTSTAP